MWTLPLLLAMATADSMPSAPLAPWSGAPARDGEVSYFLPDGWRALVAHDAHNVLLSHGLVTTFTLYWYDAKTATDDAILDTVLRTTSDNLWVGTLTEVERMDMTPRRGHALHATFSLLGYELPVGVWIENDPILDRMLAAVWVTDPETWTQAGGLHALGFLAAAVVFDGDAERANAWRPEEYLLYPEPAEAPLP
jgi:hypothetical protein